MASENLVSSKLVFRKATVAARGGTYESDQRYSEFTCLSKNPLDSTIRASFDNPIVGPSNAEDPTCRLQDMVNKKGKLSHN